MRINDVWKSTRRTDKIWDYVGSPEMWPLFHVKAGDCRRGQPRTRCYRLGLRHRVPARLQDLDDSL